MSDIERVMNEVDDLNNKLLNALIVLQNETICNEHVLNQIVHVCQLAFNPAYNQISNMVYAYRQDNQPAEGDA